MFRYCENILLQYTNIITSVIEFIPPMRKLGNDKNRETAKRNCKSAVSCAVNALNAPQEIALRRKLPVNVANDGMFFFLSR